MVATNGSHWQYIKVMLCSPPVCYTYTLDGSFSSETEVRNEAAATTLPPPSEKEEQQMALLWAMEEVNSPKGWDEDEELDYSAVSRRREERKENGKHCF